jgi:diguanylate cyclase (GGDEF)-like protein
MPPSSAVAASLPFNEALRMNALRSYDVLDTEPEQAYDDLTMLASAVCRTPMALITLVDSHRQWFKSRVGMEMTETSREVSFCAHTIISPDRTFEVADATQDPRFARNPLVVGDPNIRFYAGSPLVTPQGLPIGAVCVLDRQSRRLDDLERQALASLARQVVTHLELRQSRAALARDSLTDPLTGLWNRRAFDRRLPEEWMRHSRTGKPLSLVAFDLDHFKRINDSFGHPAGDEVLAKAANVIARGVRLSDLAARTGGEEFMLLLPETDEAAAMRVAEKLRQAFISASWPYAPVTVSVGVASVHPTRHADPHALVACADRALYTAKQRGRNRVQAFGEWH